MVPMWHKMREMRGKGKDGGPEATRTFSMVRLLLWGHDDADIAGNLERGC
jgi:hypothetical protein